MLSGIIPSHHIEKIRILHIFPEWIFLDLEMEMDIPVVLLRYSARPDIPHVFSFLNICPDLYGGGYLGEMRVEYDIPIHGLQPYLVSSEYVEIPELIIV